MKSFHCFRNRVLGAKPLGEGVGSNAVRPRGRLSPPFLYGLFRHFIPCNDVFLAKYACFS